MLFINSLMLAGLAALSIPIIVHLLRTQRYEQIGLGTIRFLQQAVKKHSRWRMLRRLFLLLLRLSVVLLIVLMFARPYFTENVDGIENDEKVLVLLNGSGSMLSETLGVSQFELAKDKIRSLADRLSEGNELTVAVFGDSVFEVGLQELDHITPGGAADLNAMSEWAIQKLDRWQGLKKRVYIYTDFQSNDTVASTQHSWPADVNVSIVSSQLPEWNYSISSVNNLTAYKDCKGPLEIRFKTFGPIPKGTKAKLKISFDGYREIEKTIPVDSNSIRLDWTPKRAGIAVGKVSVELDDSYTADNTLHCAFPVHDTSKVLLVEGSRGQTRYDDETFFIEKALSVSTATEQSGFEITVADELSSLPDYSVVALCNVQSLDESEIEQLELYLERGGSLIYFLGDATSLTFCNMLNSRGLFTGTISAADTLVPRPVMNWNAEHSAFKVFGHEDRGDLGRVVFKEAFKVEPGDDSDVLVSLLGGGAAVLEKNLEKGRLMVVTNPCDREWGNWPAERIYLPVMREIFSYLARQDLQRIQVDEQFQALSNGKKLGYDSNSQTVTRHDPRESDLAVVDEGSWREKLGILPDLEIDIIKTVNVEPEQSSKKGELWWYLLLAAVLLLLLENCIADRSKA